jgi:hypothetical protein
MFGLRPFGSSPSGSGPLNLIENEDVMPGYPPPSAVLLGTKYGPTGVEYTGTLIGGNSSTAAEIAEAVWGHQIALSIPQFLGLK